MDQDHPLISIIILGYNGKKYISACLSSVVDQDFPKNRYEIIWADNHSSDGSVPYIIDNFPTVKILKFEQNFGFAVGNNKATQSACGEYLVFLNQDTIAHRKWLSSLVEVMEMRQDLGACQSNMFMPWQDGFECLERQEFPHVVHYTDIGKYGYVEYLTRPMEESLWIETSFVTGAAFIIRKKIIAEMGFLFNPFLRSYSEDLELSLRLKKMGFSLAVATKSVIYHYQDNAFTNPILVLRKAYLASRNRFWAYRLNLTSKAFLELTPRLLLGAFTKVNEFGWGKFKTLTISIILLPISFIGYVVAILNYSLHPHQSNNG